MALFGPKSAVFVLEIHFFGDIFQIFDTIMTEHQKHMVFVFTLMMLMMIIIIKIINKEWRGSENSDGKWERGSPAAAGSRPT